MPAERGDGLVSRRTVLRFFGSAAGLALWLPVGTPARRATSAPAPKPTTAAGGADTS